MGSPLRKQTDGPSALPTESSLLAAGPQSTAPSKREVSPSQGPASPSPTCCCLCSPALMAGILPAHPVGAPRLPNHGLLGPAPSPRQGKRPPKHSLILLWLKIPPQSKGNERSIFLFNGSKTRRNKPDHSSSKTAVTGAEIFRALRYPSLWPPAAWDRFISPYTKPQIFPTSY